MKLRKIHTSALTGAILAALPCAALAATSFVDSFDGATASPNWENAGSVTLTSNNATFNGGTNADRVYLRTNDADYNGVDFTATATLTRTSGSTGAGSVFFGIGNGITPPNANTATPWGEPASGEFIYLRLRQNGWTTELADVNTPLGGAAVFGQANATGGNTILAQFDYTAATGTGTFTLDTDGNGIDGGDPSVSQSNLSLSGTTSKIFFGSNGGASGDNFSVTVIPEPSAFALLGLAGLGLLRRRRR